MQTDASSEAQRTWDAIAESFDSTRRKPWKQCIEYITTLKKTDVVIDCGCGNGRHLFPAAVRCSQAFGVDISKKLLSIVRQRTVENNLTNITLLHADLAHLPLRNDSVDAVLCIASLHNIKGQENRRAALREMHRILRPQATALVSVWSRWQDRYRRYFAKQLFVRSSELGDIDIYWRQHHLNVPRFYHLYSKREFVQELRDEGFLIENIEDARLASKRFPDNYFATVRKILI
ncbi:MAG TPA: class I SAM-dependent methyltransferase [Candidatus Thermoplasmatota archaeon]|nr:class I SAM-dependent methyltransferase [Candidatus Thermoplasmatota archaeon]